MVARKLDRVAIEYGFMITSASRPGMLGSRLGFDCEDAGWTDDHMIYVPIAIARNIMKHTITFREQSL